ncbi:glycerate kinase family protein [Companilactobacillus sp. DQM5]|uniref:glycerate kinase family protein n=1 Tax=Companilactobacillus sp. DQM5 TaxID=3463359 RepID=UPI0040584B7D
MKIVIAPDSFKNSLTAKEVADNIEIGFKKGLPEAEYVKVPMADGGEGTVQSMVDARNGKIVTANVTGPLGSIVEADYGLIDNNQIAIIEMSAASGIQFVDENTKNPYITTTYGTGELIKDAIKKGVKKIIIGIGGSATNDGGAGMAQALGYNLLDVNGHELDFGGKNLENLSKIKTNNVLKELKNVEILIASDVSSPLTGSKGASVVFGPQKGANEEMVKVLDNALHHYAKIIKKDLNKDIEKLPGSGAAGGLGAGLLAFTKSSMKSGVEIVTEYTRLKEKLVNADFVVVGEGSIDFQTQYGKTPIGVTKTAKEIAPDSKVIAIAGLLGKDAQVLYNQGIDAMFSCVPGVETLEKAIENTDINLQQISENIARMIKD